MSYQNRFEQLLSAKNKEELDKMFNEAIDRWLDKQFSVFGRWTARGLAAVAFAALVYIYVHTGGLSK